MTGRTVAPNRTSPWLACMALCAALVSAGAGYLAWRINTLDDTIRRKRAGLKSLYLAGRVPPNPDVKAYLDARTAQLEQRYQAQLRRVAIAPASSETVDPQLSFQQDVHDVQMTLGRLTAAREIAAPTLLGLPKELPPADVARRFLLQLGLIREAGELILGVKSVSQLVSFKVEDPQIVPPSAEAKDSFLTRLPVRVRLVTNLDGFAKIVSAFDRASPMADIQAIRLVAVAPATEGAEAKTAAPATTPMAAPTGARPQKPAPAAASTPADAPSDQLDVELVLARYLATAPDLAAPEEPKKSSKPAGGKKSAGEPRKPVE